MDKATRIYKLHRLLANRRTGISLERIMEELECSRATASRAIRELRDEFMAPLVFDGERGGYLLDGTGDGQLELPGIWFTKQELLALLTMEQMLAQIGSRYLTRLLAPIRDRLEGILGNSEFDGVNISERIRLIEHMRRNTSSGAFEPVAAATLQGKQLDIRYHSRRRDQLSHRRVSPQRLTHYRSNWYLDAWCHDRQALRRFALDRIHDASPADQDAITLPAEQLASQLDGEYGAFTGPATQLAVLRFTAEQARWVADEQWHPEQVGEWLADGRYQLSVPYAQTQELLMDIQRYGAGVEILSPTSLRQALRASLLAALQQYPANA